MLTIRPVTQADRGFWMSIDTHVTAKGLDTKIFGELGYVIFLDQEPVGLFHFSLLWDNMPFLNFIFIKKEHCRAGLGKQAMEYWEAEMKRRGFSMTLVSTQADESAQFFYRALGYQDCDCLVLNNCPMAQPAELFLCKTL